MAGAQVEQGAVEVKGGLRLFMELVKHPKSPLNVLAGVRADIEAGKAWIELRHASGKWVVEVPDVTMLNAPVAPWFRVRASDGNVLEVRRAGFGKWALFINGHEVKCIKAGGECFTGNDIVDALKKIANAITCSVGSIEPLLF